MPSPSPPPPSSPPLPPTPADYAALRRFLDSPPRTVIADWPEFLHPHDAPDDAAWPVPIGDESLELAFDALAPVARILGALVALDMAVPRAAKLAEAFGDAMPANVAAVAAVSAQLWDAVVAMNDVPAAISEFGAVYLRGNFDQFPLNEFAYALACADGGRMGEAVGCAMRFLAATDGVVNEPRLWTAFGTWWRRLRGRLALADVTTFTLDGQDAVIGDGLLTEDATSAFFWEVMGDEIESGTVAYFVARLGDDSADVRRGVLEVLANFPHPNAIPALREILVGDANVGLRRFAATAIANIQRALAAAGEAKANVAGDGREALRLYPKGEPARESPSLSADSSVETLRTALADPHRDVRAGGILALGATPHPEVKPLLISALADRAQGVRVAALQKLMPFAGEDAVIAAVTPLLAAQKAPVRAHAVRIFGQKGRAEFVPMVADVLATSTEAEVREAALAALAEIGGAAIVPALRAFAAKVNSGLLRLFVRALEASQSPDAVPVLVALLDETFERPHADLVMQALRNLGVPAAVDALIAALSHADDELRVAAARVLGSVPEPRVVDALATAESTADFSPDWPFRKIGCGALAEIGTPRAMQVLLGWYRAGDRRTRGYIVSCLTPGQESESDEARQMVLAALGDDSPEVRHSAVWKVGSLDDAEIRAAVLACMTDADDELRRTAVDVAGHRRLAGALDALRVAAATDPRDYIRHLARGAIAAIENPPPEIDYIQR